MLPQPGHTPLLDCAGLMVKPPSPQISHNGQGHASQRQSPYGATCECAWRDHCLEAERDEQNEESLRIAQKQLLHIGNPLELDQALETRRC